MAFGERGDTLLEVTFALTILAAVLSGATTIVVKSFQTGQTARERTAVSQVAQQQMEGLRSFRDTNTWTAFLTGQISPDNFNGVLLTGALGCHNPGNCFHMEKKAMATDTEYVPVSGPMDDSTPGSTLKVPTAWIEIHALPGSPAGTQDFVLYYQFENIGGGVANTNQVAYRLAANP